MFRKEHIRFNWNDREWGLLGAASQEWGHWKCHLLRRKHCSISFRKMNIMIWIDWLNRYPLKLNWVFQTGKMCNPPFSIKTRPKIGLKWCARGALLIFLVIFTKAIHILMLYLGFWHATEWSIALCLKIAHVLPHLLSFWHLFCYGISLDLKKLDLKNLMRSQKILWDLKKMLWISTK